MGRKGNWFSSVKKALSPESKEKNSQKSNKSKKKWFGKEESLIADSSTLETGTVSHPLPPPEDVPSTEVENEQTKHAYSVAAATAVASEASAAAPQVAPEIVQFPASTQFTGKSTEEAAAIKIQTAFRGFLARRALQASRGLVRLKSLVEGHAVKRQTTHTLRCMQALSRVQSRIHSRRIRMSEENQALQRQLLQKNVKELECLQMGEEWDDSLQSKEQIEANLLSKYEAAMRRERALAYSFSLQKTSKSSVRSADILFMDPTNPQWGWSWLERWMATRPWETKSMNEKEPDNDHSSVKNASLSIAGGEITKVYARHQLDSDKPSPPGSQKPSHPSTPQPKAASSAVARKSKPAKPIGSEFSPDADSKGIFSVQSERNRRHSVPGSSLKEEEKVVSSPAVPSYMASTRSATAKSRTHSALGLENVTPEKESAGNAKKRLSFSGSPARLRRHSGPPKVDSSSVADHNVNGGALS